MTIEREVMVKASPFLAVRAYMDGALQPAARERVLEKTATEFPAEAAKLRARTVVASERFPVVLVNRLIDLIAEEVHEPAPVIAHRIGRRGAEDAAGGILRLAMILISIPSLLRKLGPVWTQLYSHGKMTSRTEGRTAVLELTEFPVSSVTGCARVTGFLEWFAQKAEKNATIVHTTCRAKQGGSVCRWDLTW